MAAIAKKSTYRPNGISGKSNFVFNLLFILYGVICVAPLLLVFIISITDSGSLAEKGYSFFPTHMNLSAYRFLFIDSTELFRAYGVTIFVCVVGTTLSVLLSILYAYPISRKSFKYRNFFAFYVFFTMLFSGGLVPWYILYTKYLHLNDNIMALIMPFLINAYNILIAKTYFSNNIPEAVLESAKIDGASEFKTFIKIVIPLSKPVIATIALFTCLTYWNDWYNTLLFITNKNLYNIQFSMYKALLAVEFLKSSRVASLSVTSELLKVPGETVRMAMAIIGIGPIVFAYPFFQRYFIKGLTIGAVKG
ncbi:carbohydrate ABC transporter permease [Cohnella yongneupensis]|uniref:Carbohydrate ABC transporter permease n=1 Tax=Cohnella yongneupensis TaxID=425006 RepID=A0ABW0R357_9BACL